MRRWLMVVLLVIVAAVSVTAQTAGYNPLDWTTGDFKGAPPSGSGGTRFDDILCQYKNRDKPPPTFQGIELKQLISDQPAALVAMGKKHRRNWTPVAKEVAAKYESRGISVEGYLVYFMRSEAEACNGMSETDRDFHLCLAIDPVDRKSNRVVCEVSPRLLPSHKNWTAEMLRQLTRQKARVRLSGWVMWDNEHPANLGKTRATLWEVHPVHGIEVWSDRTWRDL